MNIQAQDNANIASRLVHLWKERDGAFPIVCMGAETVSREDLLRMAEWRRRRLQESVQPGDPVIVRSLRGPTFFADLLAVWASGGVVVPLAGDAPPEYAEEVKRISEASVVLDDLPEGSPPDTSNLCCVTVPPDALASILFTSGTTGSPKGVMLTHAALAGNCTGTLEILGMNRDRLFINTPFHFTSAICHFLACAFSGSTLVGDETKLFPADLTQALAASGCTGFGGAPVQLRWIAEYCEAAQPRQDVSMGLRFFVSSGDNLSTDVMLRLQRQLPKAKVFVVYGLTELAGRFCILDTSRFPDKIGSVGRPIRGLGVHVASTGGPVPVGEEGEVMATGDLLCTGYYRAPERTASLLTEAGLHTGDLGHMDEDGFLYLHGRLDDVFKVNGQKVSGLVIAEAMMRIPTFADVAVVRQDDPYFGTVPVAIYALRPGAEFNAGEVKAQLRRWLPANHIPRRFLPVASIPRTGSGKLQRARLLEMIVTPGQDRESV